MLPKIETNEDRRLADIQLFERTLGALRAKEPTPRPLWERALTVFYMLMFLLMGAGGVVYAFLPPGIK